MPDFNLQKQDLPLWKGGSGNLTIHVTGAQLNQPLAPSDSDLISVEFGAGGDPFLFGTDQSVKLGISAGTTLKLLPLWPSSDQQRLATLADYGLAQYFNDHPNDLVLALIIGAQADLSLAGSFRYAALQINSTLEAGGRAGYAHLRPYPANQPVQPMITDFFKNLKLPAHVTTPLQPGEVIAFDYGGYLRLGVNLAAGYEMKGAPRLDIGQLQLSEHYRLSVLGKLALNASLAGEFSVEVRAATDSNGQPMPGWARVLVRKKRDSQFKIAADVNAQAQGSLKGLPGSGREFLGAMLGVNVKNWLNVVARVHELSDLDKLKDELDGLAKDFLGEWVGKAFDELSQTEFGEFLNHKVHQVIASYENLDNSAITLFDQYFDKLNILEDKLNELTALTSWDRLQGEVDDDLWRIVQQLTGGDPLGWMLGNIKVRDKNGNVVTIPTLPKLKELAAQTLDLLREDGHIVIRGLIKLAKSEFPLDGFLQKLAQVDTVPELKAIAGQRLGAFVERLTGRAVNALANSELSATITRLHRLLDAVADFEQKLYGKLKEAAEHRASFQLHAEYSRADHREALIDLRLNLQTARGRELMHAAGHGDFQEALSVYDASVVQLNHGLLTHRLSKQSSFNINVIGWHSGWHYQGMDLVLVQTEQQIEAAENGRLNVFTTIDLKKEKERKSNRTGERMYTNFLLRFLGEAHGVLKFDARNQQYLIDTLTGMVARYRLSFDDARTTRDELDYYLSFAAEFGLAAQGATLSQVLPLLPHQPGDDNNFGQVSVEYEARYTEAGLRKLFSTPFDAAAESKVRQIMREVVLTNYVRNQGLAAVGWCYWTPGVYDLWKQGQAEFVNVGSAREFKPLSKSPFTQLAAPNKAVLSPTQIRLLSTLFFIEDHLIVGLRRLAGLIAAGQMIGPHDFENALKDIGDALKSFDDFDEGVNTVFAVFDRLIQAQTPADEARLSSLTLVSAVGNQHFTRQFIAQPEALPEAALAGSVSG